MSAATKRIDIVIQRLRYPIERRTHCATREELLALISEIVERLNKPDAIESLQARAALNVGTKPSFDLKRRHQTGRVMKLNTKTLGVLTADGRRWKAPPHGFLREVLQPSEPNAHVLN